MRFPKISRRGGIALAITAGVLAAVILLNVGVSALFGLNLLFLDLTNESIYRLHADTVRVMDQTVAEANEVARGEGLERAQAEILFCSDPDLLVRDEQMRYIYYTAKALAKRYPSFVKVKTVDVWSNPSAVDAYRATSYTTISQTNVIVSSGGEYRLLYKSSFYTTSGDSDVPWGYSGEKQFVKTIRAITRVETPVCCLTVNHGEPLADETAYSALLSTIRHSGFKIQRIDLATEEIPEDCRMVLIFDPQRDFTSGNYLSGNPSELGKLDVFLRDANTLMLFADAQTPVLPNLEAFLEDWGIQFVRYTDPENELQSLGNYQVVSPLDSVDEDGTAVIADYETSGRGAAFTKEMRTAGASPKVVFPNAMPLQLSPSYDLDIVVQTDSRARYEYGKYEKNEEQRAVYNIFYSSGQDRLTYAKAVGFDGGDLTDAGGNLITDSRGNFPLATFTIRFDDETESAVSGQSTYVERDSKVFVFSSTEFASDELLKSGSFGSAYGNTDLLSYIMNYASSETFPTGISLVRLHQTAMGADYYNSNGNFGWAIALALIPATVAAALGIWMLMRRRRAR